MPGRTLATWYGSGSNPTEHNYQSLESSIYSQSSHYTGSNQNDQDHQYDTGYGYHPVNQGNSTPHYPEQRRAFSPNYTHQPSSYTPPSPVPNNYQFSQHLSLSLAAPTSHGMNYSNSQQHQAALYASGPSPSHYGASSHGYSPSSNNSNAAGGPQWQQQTAQHHPGSSPQHSSVLTVSPSASSPSPAHTPSPLHSPPPSQTMSGQYPAHHHGRHPPMGSPSQSAQGHNLSSWSHHGVGQGQGMNIHPGGMMSGPPPQGPGYYPAPHPSLIGPGRGPQGPPQHAHMASSGDRRSPLPAPGHWNSVAGGPTTKPSIPHGPPPPSSHPQQNSSLGNAGGGNPLFSLQMLVNQEMNRNAAAAVMQANSYRGPAASMVHQQETVDLSQTSSSAENYSRLSPQQTGPIPLTRSDKQPLPEQASVRNGSIIASTTSSSALANTSATSPPTPLNGEVSSDSGIDGNANSVSASEMPISSSSTIADTSKPKTVDLTESKPLTKESVSVIAQAPVREKPAPSPQIMTTSPPPVVEKVENIKQESETTVVKVAASETDKEVAPVQKESSLPKAAEDNGEKTSALVISSTSDVPQTLRESAVSSSSITTSFTKQPDDTLSIPSPASKDSTSPVRSPKSGPIKRTKKVDSILENLVESGTKKLGGAVSTALIGEQAPQTSASSATPVVVAPASVIVSPVTTSEDSSSGLGHEASAASPGIQQKPPPEQHKSPILEEDAVSPTSGGDDSENGKPRRKRKLDKPHRLSKAPGEGDGEKCPNSEPDLTPKDENSQKSEDGTFNEGNQESKEELIVEESPSSTTNMDQEAPSKPIETITVDVINGQSADEKIESNRRRRSSEGSATSPTAAWSASGQRMRRKSANDRQEDGSNNGDLLAVLVTDQSDKNSLGDSKPEVKNAFIEVETELEKMFAGIVETEECVDPLKLDTASPIPMEVSPSTKNLDSLTNIDSTSTTETKQVSGTKARGRPKGSRNGTRRSSESIFGPSSTDSTPKKKKKKLGKRQADESPSSSQQQKKTKRAKLFHGDFAGDIPFQRKKNLMKSELSCRDGSLQSASLYDSGSNTSTTRSRGPVIHIEGPRDNPYHVSVINTPIRGEDEDGGERGSSKKQTGTAVRRKNSSYHNDLEYRGKVTASGATGTAMFSSTLSARYDAHTTDRTWICVFCKRGPHSSVGGGGTSGDLFGPYLLSTPDKLEMNGDGSADERDITEEQKRSGGRNKRSLRGAHMVEQFCQKMSRKVRRSHSQDNAPVLGMVPVASTGTTEEDGCYEVWVHEDCAVWAAGVHVVGSRIVGLQEAVWSAVRTICSKCGEGGANVGCVRRGCEWRLHYGCAREQGWELDEESYVACCTQHKKGAYSSEEAILPT